MDYLKQLSEFARGWASQFEVNRAYWVVLALLLVVCVHYLLVSVLLFRLSVIWRRPLARLLHPALFAKGSVWRDRAAVLQTWLDRYAGNASDRNILHSPRGSYQLLHRLSGGDLCDVFTASGNGRTYVLKRSRVPEGNRLLSKEQDLVEKLLACRDGGLGRKSLPWPVDSLVVGDRQVTVWARRDGFLEATSLLRGHPQGLDEDSLSWIFTGLLEVLGYVHQQGWVHGAALPPHLLLHMDSRTVQLLSWYHAQRPGVALQLVPARYKNWYPPECHAQQGAMPATDIFLAAQCILFLAGGDPKGGTIPARVSLRMRQCLRKCLAVSAAQRPQDAWMLRRDFNTMLGYAAVES